MRVLGCGLALALLLMPAANAAGQSPRVLRMSSFNADPSTVLARASGALAAAGLDVDITITPNSTEQMQGLSDGTFDVVSTAFDNVLAWSGPPPPGSRRCRRSAARRRSSIRRLTHRRWQQG